MSRWREARKYRAAAIALSALLSCCNFAFPLDPSLDISQYAHMAWLSREGFPKGLVETIAQTPDGYLWLGTEFGLLRFDGVRAVPWQPPPGQHLPGIEIRTLLAARDGTLWIGATGGLASWKDGKLTQYPELAGKWVGPLLEDRDGTVWAGAWTPTAGRLCAIHNSVVQCFGADGSFSYAVFSLYEDSRGILWVGTGNGVWRWRPGPRKFYPMPATPDGIQGLAEDNNGALLVATGSGIVRIVDGKVEAYPLPGIGLPFSPHRLLRDRDGSLWIATVDRGLLHLHQGRIDAFARPDGLSSDNVLRLFEDREGNIWTGTYGGLDRFRDFAVPTISMNQGLSGATIGSVLAAKDGSVWIGTFDGLNQLNNGQITIYRKPRAKGAGGAKQNQQLSQSDAANRRVREISDPGLPDNSFESLFQDTEGRVWMSMHSGVAYLENGRFISVRGVPAGQVHFIAEDRAGDIWISYENQGLFHLSRASVVEQIPWARLGHNDYVPALAADPLQGGLWLGFFEGGLAYFKDGRILASYSVADGLGQGRINDLQSDRDGTLWASTDGGLSRVINGRIATLTSRNGLPCDAVHWMMEDDSHSVWLYMPCGLVRIAATDLDAWVANPKRTIRTTVFDVSDGVRSHSEAGGYSPRVGRSTDGKLWFSVWDGVSVIDPRHLAFNKLPPPVHIEQVIADGKTYWQNLSVDASSSHPRLPPLVRDLTIDYTALSFVAPEKVLFRYKLEGLDRDWQDAGNRRQAFYTNLAPGNYRFRVTACNSSGVWNEAGTFVDFSIAPAYYQTTWFRVSCVAALVVLLWMAYKLRIRSIQQHAEQLAQHAEQLALMNAKLETQIAERKQAEQALRQAQADLTHANRVSSMGELTASLAHEVNQPIAAAIMDANTCLRWLSRDQPDLEEARAAASRIAQDGKRASEIVNRVRLLFKKSTLQRELVDLNEIIREMVLLLYGEATRYAVFVRTELVVDLPQVVGDHVQLQQVLMNLMMNSIDAMKDVDGRRELTIQSQHGEDGQVLISVSDTGVGLPPQQADKIFEAFFTTKTHGTGMGLRISRSIVESHRGRLWAADNSPRGARFCFTLPANGETGDSVVSGDRTESVDGLHANNPVV